MKNGTADRPTRPVTTNLVREFQSSIECASSRSNGGIGTSGSTTRIRAAPLRAATRSATGSAARNAEGLPSCANRGGQTRLTDSRQSQLIDSLTRLSYFAPARSLDAGSGE